MRVRALSFRRFTTPSVADIVWAKRERLSILRDRKELHRRRLAISLPPLLARLELINTFPAVAKIAA